MELEVLYHGTKFKYITNKILKEGFEKWTYFSTDLNTAIGQGGKYVFEVVFLKKDLPHYWQVRCENKISPNRIIRLTKHTKIELLENKKLKDKVYDNALEYVKRKSYHFKEIKNEINNLLKIKKY